MTKPESSVPAPKAPSLPGAKPLPRPKAAGAPASGAAKAAPATSPANQPGAGVPPPVAQSFMRPRHGLLIFSFILCVLVPSGVTGWYLWTQAADQYVSKVGFSVRREDNSSAIELLGGLGNFSGSSSSDTDILYEFIQSQRLVSEIDSALDLRMIWSRPVNDPVFSLDPEASLETLVEYWEQMVRLSYGAGSGLLEVEVRAFTAADATLIAETLFGESSKMINQLSAIAREDAIRYANEELGVALE
ncbi:MAG: sugar transporter, partial [Pseudomonadota bacterium]